MSLLTPERVTVKIYRWDDAGAPALDKTAGCMMTIFKACLVTGYGTKEPAGWTMPFEDTEAGVKVFRPPLSPDADYYLQLSSDTGNDMQAKVYKEMTAANTGSLLLECAAPFIYGYIPMSGKWVMLVSDFGMYFFCEYEYDSAMGKTGRFFACNKLVSVDNTLDAGVFLHHSAGARSQHDAHSSITGIGVNGMIVKTIGSYAPGRALVDGVVHNIEVDGTFDGYATHTSSDIAWQAFVKVSNAMFFLPGLYIPFNGRVDNNYTITQSASMRTITHHTGGFNATSSIKIQLDEWVY